MNKKGVILFAALLVLAILGITFFGGVTAYVFFFTVLLLPIVCYGYILLVIRSLKIYQRTEGRTMVCGTPSDFYITLQNEGIFAFSSLRIIFYSSFSGISEIDDGAEYELPPHSSIQRKTKLLCRYRGEYCVGIKQIVVKDFLNLFSVTYRIKEPLSVIVAPAMVHLEELEGRELLSDADRDNLQKKTDPDIPVREYVEGDDIRFLNWKATALMQKLMVRERRGEEKSGIAIVMDPGRYQREEEEYLPLENKVMEWTLALAFYYMENNIPVDVIYGAVGNKAGGSLQSAGGLKSVNTVSVRDAGNYECLYEEMCGFSFREERSMKGTLSDLYEKMVLADYRMLIFVSQNWCTEENELAEQINAEKVPIRVYLVEKEANRIAEDMSKGGVQDHRTEIIPLYVEKAGRKAATELTAKAGAKHAGKEAVV